MTVHIFRESTISPPGPSPVQRNISIRNVCDASGPHLITFGVRTVVADAAASFCSMRVQYESPNGELRTIYAGDADLSVVTDVAGAMWYAPQVMTIDERHPLGDGAGEDPYGTFMIRLNCAAPGTSKISYECVVEQFDGSSTVVYHP